MDEINFDDFSNEELQAMVDDGSISEQELTEYLKGRN